jgi:hypothetical protein
MKINGNLVFNSDASGEVQHAYIERKASAPAFDSAHKGRLYFNTSSSLYYFNDGSAYVPFATGGNAAALQTEVDNIEATVGPIINGDGTFNSGGISGSPIIGTATSITNALNLLAAAANATDTLGELHDVALGTLSNGQYLRYSTGTGKWVNSTLVVADVTDLAASAAELNILDGATLDVTELNFVDGVTSPIQTQLNNKQPLDAGLTALAAFNANGILVQTAEDTFAARSLVAPSEGFAITNADGVAGNPTFLLNHDLQAVEGLAGSGYAVRTGTDTWTNRTFSGITGRTVVSNGDGVASNTDIDLATVADSGAGTFKKITVDSYGRVNGTAPVLSADITALVSGVYVDVVGDSMTGNLTMTGGATVTGLPAPVAGTDATNKNYVDAAVAGLSWKQAVNAMSTTNVDVASAPAALDGHTLVAGERVLLTGQTTASENGIYVFSAAAAALVRSTDADAFGELSGAAVFVEEGTLYANSGWTQSANLTSFSGQTWVQFTGAGTYVAGAGMSLTGNTFDVNLGAGIAQLPTDEVGIDLYSSTSALILTTDGTAGGSTATGAKLHLKLGTAGGLVQDITGLYVSANGITNAMILNDSHALNGDTGTGALALGDTLLVVGNSPQGIVTSVADSTFTVTASDASTSQKGVARFDSSDFEVAGGIVSVKEAGIDNDQLLHSGFTINGDTGTDTVKLGETISFVGDETGIMSTNVDTNSVAFSIQKATTAALGVASFATADFTVAVGHVTAKAKSLDDLTDVAVSGATAGQTLVSNGTNFINVNTYHLYESLSPTTSHNITHNLGQKFCNVTVVDSSDEVVIPQSITFNNDNQLTVAFTSAIHCKVVIMGIAMPSNVGPLP